MYLLLGGIGLLVVTTGLFWLKDHRQSQLLARIAYSGLVARLAVIGAVFIFLGVLLLVSGYFTS